jgi:hypothetical protein
MKVPVGGIFMYRHSIKATNEKKGGAIFLQQVVKTPQTTLI